MEEEQGSLEKINSHHAWRTRKSSDGLNLFQLENHADHPMHPNRSYELLSRHDDSPEMPTGYSGMIVLALLPPLWFRIMNKKIHLINEWIKKYGPDALYSEEKKWLSCKTETIMKRWNRNRPIVQINDRYPPLVGKDPVLLLITGSFRVNSSSSIFGRLANPGYYLKKVLK